MSLEQLPQFSSPILEKNQEEKEQQIKTLIREKLFASWGAVSSKLGVPNNNLMAELFYRSLYFPDNFSDGEIEDGGFGRLETLKKSLNIAQKPDLKDFVNVIIRALTTDVKFSQILFDGALQTVRELSEFGHIMIWTKGDVYGIDEYKGSAEQIKKVATSGIGELRKEIANERGLNRHEIISLSASEDKISEVPSIVKSFLEKGVKTIIIIDDRASNLYKAIEKANQFEDVKFIPILVCQGKAYSQKAKAKDNYYKQKEELNGVENVADLPEKISSFNLNGEIGIMLDFDDVLSDDFKRENAQFESVFSKLKEKQWI